MTASSGGNVRLRAARESQGLVSQADFVDALTAKASELGLGELSLTTRTIRRWESAKPGWPHRPHIRALEALFGQPATELGFIPRSSNAIREYTDEATTVATHSPVSESPDTRPAELRETIPSIAHQHYALLTKSYRTMYWSVPAAALRRPIFRHAELGQALLAAAASTDRPFTAAATAEAWMLAGRILLFDSQKPADASPCFVTAIECAHQADDHALGAAALAHLAIVAATPPHPINTGAGEKMRMARTFARRAGEPPLLIAWLDTVESDIEARTGNLPRAASLIGHAEQTFPGGPPEPEWLDWFPPHRLTTSKANTLLATGRFADARMTLDRALHALPQEEKKLRALTYCDLALIAALARDPQTACQIAGQALDEIGDQWYSAVAQRLETVRGALAEWDSSAAVGALDARIYGWLPTINTVATA